MDPGEHDIIYDVNSLESQSIFNLGNTSSSSNLNNNVSTIMSPTSGTGGSGGGLDLLDLLGGGGSSETTVVSSNDTSSAQTTMNNALPSSLSTSFPTLSNMPLFATVPASAVNGTVGSGQSTQQFELIPGQLFPGNFFSLNKSEQLASLRQKVEQDSIMSGKL